MAKRQKSKRKTGPTLTKKTSQELQSVSVVAEKPAPIAQAVPASEKEAELALQDTELSWEMKQKKLCSVLKEVYSTSETSDGKACVICGELDWQLCQTDDGLLMCRSCMESEITSMHEAAELLYTTYGNFKRLFSNVTFRYPDLKLSERSMYDIKDFKPHGKNISDLVNTTDNKDSWMALCVARDIPYSLLEELYVRAFSDQMMSKGEKVTSCDNPPQEFSSSSEIVKYYLKKTGRNRQAELIQSDL